MGRYLDLKNWKIRGLTFLFTLYALPLQASTNPETPQHTPKITAKEPLTEAEQAEIDAMLADVTRHQGFARLMLSNFMCRGLYQADLCFTGRLAPMKCRKTPVSGKVYVSTFADPEYKRPVFHANEYEFSPPIDMIRQLRHDRQYNEAVKIHELMVDRMSTHTLDPSLKRRDLDFHKLKNVTDPAYIAGHGLEIKLMEAKFWLGRLKKNHPWHKIVRPNPEKGLAILRYLRVMEAQGLLEDERKLAELDKELLYLKNGYTVLMWAAHRKGIDTEEALGQFMRLNTGHNHLFSSYPEMGDFMFLLFKKRQAYLTENYSNLVHQNQALPFEIIDGIMNHKESFSLPGLREDLLLLEGKLSEFHPLEAVMFKGKRDGDEDAITPGCPDTKTPEADMGFVLIQAKREGVCSDPLESPLG
jgi:hypothetical protein